MSGNVASFNIVQRSVSIAQKTTQITSNHGIYDASNGSNLNHNSLYKNKDTKYKAPIFTNTVKKHLIAKEII
ncbi:hypothetical protein GW750_02250 [bacterium]|nr:hypothetical protein [bacterium]